MKPTPLISGRRLQNFNGGSRQERLEEAQSAHKVCAADAIADSYDGIIKDLQWKNRNKSKLAVIEVAAHIPDKSNRQDNADDRIEAMEINA